MRSEFEQRPAWRTVGKYRVSSKLFLDVVFTSACDCACPFCIARTKGYAREDKAAWEQAVADAFRLFDIRNVILVGGEATIDPCFWEKLGLLTEAMAGRNVDHLILTTNGNRLRDPDFLRWLLSSRIDAVNLSRMHDHQEINDRIFCSRILTEQEITGLCQRLHAAGKTLRLNVNVWQGNLDKVEEMERFVRTFAGKYDAIKFTPLMETDMFDTVDEVTEYTRKYSIPESGIRKLWNAFADRHTYIRAAKEVLGFVEYAEIRAYGQPVILKYAQVEDKYDRETEIPTLKLYPNGCLSNEWSFVRDIRAGLKGE